MRFALWTGVERADNAGVMDFTLLSHPTPLGLALAAAAVALGAPIFADGLRILRLRRHLDRLTEVPLSGSPAGFVHVRGRVALESPLFSPLTGSPCAAFRLGVSGMGAPFDRAVDVCRPFRLDGDGASARVNPRRVRLDLRPGARLEVAANEPVSEHVASLIERVPEAVWWRRAGGSLRLVECLLTAGSIGHVVGTVRRERAAAPALATEIVRTGTGDVPHVTATVTGEAAPELAIAAGDQLDFLLVGDRTPRLERVPRPAWRTAGVVLGPALSLLGMLYLAGAADRLRALGWF